MNNRVYISGAVTGNPRWGVTFHNAERHVESAQFFDRHGDARLAERYGKFGFVAVTPRKKKHPEKPHILALRRCSRVYMLRDWYDSKAAKKEHYWATLLGKIIIYQEDEQCR